MNQIIPEKFYVKAIDRHINRIKTDKGYLYDYKDLCKEVLIPDRERKEIFYNWLYDYEREEIRFECSVVKYITAEGFKKIISRNYQRGMWIYDELTTSELEDSDIIDLIKEIPNGTATKIINDIYNVYHSKEYKEQLWKLHPEIDRDKDMLSEKLHYDLVYNDLDYDEFVIMKKRSDTGEEQWEQYKKNPNKGTSCPPWLIDIIK